MLDETKSFLTRHRVDFFVLLWTAMLLQIFPCGVQGSHGSVWNVFGYPFPFYSDQFFLQEGPPQRWSFENQFSIWHLLLSALSVLGFSITYVVGFRGIFHSCRLNSARVTHTAVLLLILAADLFVALRAWSYISLHEIELPLRSHLFGLPLPAYWPSPDDSPAPFFFSLPENLLIALLFSSLVAMIQGFVQKARENRIK